ncbi:hypothetical protein VTJ04DRAFT_7542 [Mycothermus thermophilus]|uniref:uncharacterized protein n=1 Tax=Humicola insolens TaxID=85995 RepID=UPI003742B4E5
MFFFRRQSGRPRISHERNTIDEMGFILGVSACGRKGKIAGVGRSVTRFLLFLRLLGLSFYGREGVLLSKTSGQRTKTLVFLREPVVHGSPG